MRYFMGTMDHLQRVFRALDKLAGLPLKVLPSPPAAEEWSEGAFGWTSHLIGPAEEVADGSGLMEAPENVDPYLGQSTEIDGEQVTIPSASDLLERSQLPPAYETYLYNKENPWVAGGGREP